MSAKRPSLRLFTPQSLYGRGMQFYSCEGGTRLRSGVLRIIDTYTHIGIISSVTRWMVLSWVLMYKTGIHRACKDFQRAQPQEINVSYCNLSAIRPCSCDPAACTIRTSMFEAFAAVRIRTIAYVDKAINRSRFWGVGPVHELHFVREPSFISLRERITLAISAQILRHLVAAYDTKRLG